MHVQCKNIQVIVIVVESPLALLLNFDVDSCCFAYVPDDLKVYTTPRGIRALRYGCNVMDSQFSSPSYCHRLEKYAERGFSIAAHG